MNVLAGEVRAAGLVRGARVVLFIGMTLAALLAVPRLTSAAEAAPSDLKACLDAAFAKYNGCLMEADNRFERWLCDASFEAYGAWCIATSLGEIYDALQGNR